jgi:hypothetical protein
MSRTASFSKRATMLMLALQQVRCYEQICFWGDFLLAVVLALVSSIASFTYRTDAGGSSRQNFRRCLPACPENAAGESVVS